VIVSAPIKNANAQPARKSVTLSEVWKLHSRLISWNSVDQLWPLPARSMSDLNCFAKLAKALPSMRGR
jgi:hypothetical protein